MVVVEGEARAYGEGEAFVVPPGVSHEMWTQEAGTRMTWRIRPAMKTEAFFETLWGLARAGKTDEKGVPNLLRVAVLFREYSEEFRLARPPWPVRRSLFALLAPLGRLLGYRARYSERGG